jgi:hypothetical protein
MPGHKGKQDAIDLQSYYHPDYFGVQEALPEQMKDIKNGLKTMSM